MPRRKDVKKVLVIGSGPIIIGQPQNLIMPERRHVRLLKMIISSCADKQQPATIMTDTAIADKVYIEPLHIEILKR